MTRRGSPLTPAETQRVVALYEQTANACEVARQLGISESGVRYVLSRTKYRQRQELHAAAVDAGIREARAALRKVVSKARKMLEEPLEPRDLRDLASASSTACSRFLDIKRERLLRDKLRAETELTRERTRALVQWDEVLAAATPEERAAIYEVTQRVRERQQASAASEPVGGTGEPAERADG